MPDCDGGAFNHTPTNQCTFHCLPAVVNLLMIMAAALLLLLLLLTVAVSASSR